MKTQEINNAKLRNQDITNLKEYSTIWIDMVSKSVKTFNERKQTYEIINFLEAGIEELTKDEIEEHYQDDYNVLFE